MWPMRMSFDNAIWIFESGLLVIRIVLVRRKACVAAALSRERFCGSMLMCGIGGIETRWFSETFKIVSSRLTER